MTEHRTIRIMIAATWWLTLFVLVLTRVAAGQAMVNCTFTIRTWNRAAGKLERKAPGGAWIPTPLRISLPEGNWTFRASAAGCVSETLTTTLRAPRFSHTFNLPQPPPPPTKVMVRRIAPSNADLRLEDGRPIRPGVWINVSPGRHTITSRLNSSFRHSFTVRLGESETIPEIEVPVAGTVKVAIDPPAVSEITLVDRADNAKKYRVAAGREYLLPPGEYSIMDPPYGCSLKNPQQTVNVQPGKQTDVLVSIVTPWFCDECRRYFESQAALDRHTPEHTWVMIEQVQPADAELVLDGRTPIKRGEKITVSPGQHTITGESSRGYLKEPYEPPYKFEMTAGQPKTIAKITVPDNAPPSVKIGSVDPPTAAITVNGRSAEANSTVKIVPAGNADSVNISVVVEKEDYRTWTEAREVRWKEVWEIPDPVTLPRLRWGEVCRTVDPGEMDEYTRVWLVDSAGVEHEIKHGPKCTRIDLDDVKQRRYTVKIKPPTDYRVKDAPSDVTVVDHERTTVPVKLEKKVGHLSVSYVPKPVVSVSVYDEFGNSRGSGDKGWDLAPDITHVFVFKAFGFKDLTLTVTLQPGEERTETVRMIPLPAFLKLTTKLSCGGDRPGHAIVEITDTAGTVVAKDTSETAERTIELSPGEDGSDKVYHYRVSRDGFMKDLRTADWQGDIVAQRGKTIQLDTMVLKCIRQILRECVLEQNPCQPRDDLTSEGLLIAAELASADGIKDKFVEHGFGCKWGEVAQKFAVKAVEKCVIENDPCVPRDDIEAKVLLRAAQLAEWLAKTKPDFGSGWRRDVKPRCGCTWGDMADKLRKKADEIGARTDSGPTGGSK